MYFYVSHESSFRFPYQDLNKENWNISYYSFYECRLRQFNPANLNWAPKQWSWGKDRL